MAEVNLSPYTAEYEAIQRRRKMAEALQAQAMQQDPINQTAGGYVIPIPKMAGVNKVLQQALSLYANRKADEDAKALGEKQRQDSQTDYSALLGALQPRQAIEAPSAELGGGPGREAMPAAGITPELFGRLKTPQAQQMAMSLAAQQFAPKDSPFAKIDPSKFTPESIASFSQGGGRDFTQLRPVQKPERLAFQDTGNGIQAFNAITGEPVGGVIPKSVTPDKAAGLNMDMFKFLNLSEQQKQALQIQLQQANTSAVNAANQGLETQFNTGQGVMPQMPSGGPIAPPVAPQSAPRPIPGNAQGPTGSTLDLNNPGGLRPIGASTGFQRFETPEQGIQALTGNLRAYGDRGINTIEKIVSTWAPSNENNTRAYINSVSQRLGIPANQQLDMKNPYLLQALTTAIMLHEQGPRLFASSGGGAQAPMAQPGVNARPGITPRMAAENNAKIDLSRRQAESELPKVIDTAERALRQVDELIGSEDGKIKRHPGFNSAVGAGLPGLRFVPGTDTRSFMNRLDQLKGGAFLEAFEALKGGGQITQIEGDKATAAINRMDAATSEKEFVAAARDFQQVVRTGIKNARMRAGQNPQQAAPRIPANIDDLVRMYAKPK